MLKKAPSPGLSSWLDSLYENAIFDENETFTDKIFEIKTFMKPFENMPF
jgi:hypothetical protein